jgi:hypothetical protein
LFLGQAFVLQLDRIAVKLFQWPAPFEAARIVALFLIVSLLAGCGVFRAIPSHGGGKRFDEEQRVVASAIRYTLADMDLAELRGKRVFIQLDQMAQDGAGTVTFPGIANLGGGVNASVGQGSVVQVVPGIPGPRTTINDNDTNNLSGNASFGLRPDTSFTPLTASTTGDGLYFRAALEMKARHAGVIVAKDATADVTLYVLVDVLGTNRSHTGSLLVSSEKLVASCEATYYAQETKSGRMVFDARRASSEASYREMRGWGTKGAIVDREAGRTEPTPLPIDAEDKPATRPTTEAMAKKRPWFDRLITRMAEVE